ERRKAENPEALKEEIFQSSIGRKADRLVSLNIHERAFTGHGFFEKYSSPREQYGWPLRRISFRLFEASYYFLNTDIPTPNRSNFLDNMIKKFDQLSPSTHPLFNILKINNLTY